MVCILIENLTIDCQGFILKIMPKHSIRYSVFGILLSWAIIFLAPATASAANYNFKLSTETTINAQVGKYYLDISGYVSPFASVVLSTDGIFLRSTVADSKGNFYITGVLINAGFSHFCLEAVDFKRIGDSYTCIQVPPAVGSIKKDDIFLPPTLGISKTSIAEGEEFQAFGYTMPNAYVTLKLGNGRTETVLADGTGYYIFKIKNLPSGSYELFATARYNNQDSLSPTRKLQLHSLSLWEQIIAFIRYIIFRILELLTSIALGPLWLAIPILILIIILILKLWPERFTFISHGPLAKLLASRKHPEHLHHFYLYGE